MPKLIIVVEGGVVQAVVSDDPAALSRVEVHLVDYDDNDAGRLQITRAHPDVLDLVQEHEA